MLGTKKLATVRKQIEEALASASTDPIQRLEKLVASAQRKGERTELLDGLKRFLNRPRSRTIAKSALVQKLSKKWAKARRAASRPAVHRHLCRSLALVEVPGSRRRI
jgi:hypothetical protein